MRRASSIIGLFGSAALRFAVVVVLVAGSITSARAEPGFSGMQLQGVGDRIAKALGMQKPNGVLIRDVAIGEAAAKAGLKRGDLIVEFAERKIDTFDSLIKAATKTRVGQTVEVEVLRGGKKVEVKMTLGRKPPTWKVANGSVANLPAAGLTLAAITPKIRKRFNLRWGAVGVLVTLIDPEHAQRTVMKRGDVIVQVNQQDVWLPSQVVAAYQDAKAAKRDRVLLLVERLGAYEFMLLPVR